MSNFQQPRVARGTPKRGGQWSSKHTGEAAGVDLVELAAPPPVEPPPTVPAGGDGSFAGVDRADRVEAMRSEIDRAIEHMSNSEGWVEYLDQARKFHKYSINNQLLILFQKRNATAVAGFKDWKNNHERTVKKGEKAIWILAPMTKTVETPDPDTGNPRKETRVFGFRSVPVFDVSQTEGKPLPEPPLIELDGDEDGPAPEGMVKDLTSVVNDAGFSIAYRSMDGEDKGKLGYTSFTGKKVVIDINLSPRRQARTLAHEAAHIALGHDKQIHEYHSGTGGHRPDMEVEAESVAYILGRQYGLPGDKDSFRYIDGWAQGDKERVSKTATRVCVAARDILNKIDTKEPVPA